MSLIQQGTVLAKRAALVAPNGDLNPKQHWILEA